MVRPSARVLGLAILGAVVYWLVVVAALHALEPEFNPLQAPMSAYVLGRYGAWMTSTYPVLALAAWSVAGGFASAVPLAPSTRVACALFVLAGSAACLAGLFPMDFPPPPRTAAGRVHAVAGLLTFLPLVVGTVLISRGARQEPGWQKTAGVLSALAGGAMLGLLLLAISVRTLGTAGLAQRVLMALLLAWMFVVGVRLSGSRPAA